MKERSPFAGVPPSQRPVAGFNLVQPDEDEDFDEA